MTNVVQLKKGAVPNFGGMESGTSAKTEKPKSKRVRRVKIIQYENNPVTGESLNFDEQNILNALAYFSHRTKRWAWIKHDKDVITEADIRDEVIDNKDVRHNPEDIGKPKGTHYHVVMELTNAASISAIAKRFGVPAQYVEVIEGSTKTHDAVLDCIAYLTHEDAKQQQYGKHLYDRDEVYISDSNIWIDVDNQKAREALTKGGSRADARVIIEKISQGMTLSQVYEFDNVMAVENKNLFKTARQEYLKNAPVPPVRTNYYVYGEGGTGKSLSAKVLARSLRPDITKDEELYFVVGDGNVPFDGYDGQPIIIWDDWRALDLLTHFDRSLVWKLFAINPERISVNVKYGSTSLINAVNIVTCVDPYLKFMEELAGEYTDKRGIKYKKEDSRQAFRRFPFFIEVTAESLLIARNRGLSKNEIAQVEPLLKFENGMMQLAKQQERGGRKEVADILEQPLALMESEAKKYQGTHDDDFEPIKALKLLPLDDEC